MGINYPYYGKCISTNFPGSSHTMSFVAFSHTIKNWWGNPCISHMIKYTIRWESNGKKAAIIWEKYEYQFPRLLPYHGFCCIFLYCGKFMRKPMPFPYAEVYHRIEIGWKKAPILWEKYGYYFPRLSLYHGFCCIFPECQKFMGKPMHFPYDDIS